ncbi:MAG: hypothetical protein JNL74_22095 [Fibrobacteres bacterium]|nr:hypothetical protein [Fibrobacterota bacterium]
MFTKLLTFCMMCLLYASSIFAKESDSDSGRYFIGTSAFVIANLVPNQENPPNFAQLNLGYWLTSRDVISLEAVTWKYNAPKGIPYGSSFDDPKNGFPGYVREAGIGIAYQRFFWNGLYTGIHAQPLYQQFKDTVDNSVQKSFTLFMTFRVGYHIKLFKNNVFIEPSLACTYWPISTNIPESFERVENKWPNYFLFEPGLHLGVKF